MQKTDGPWRITLDYYKFSQVVTAIAAAAPGMFSAGVKSAQPLEQGFLAYGFSTATCSSAPPEGSL